MLGMLAFLKLFFFFFLLKIFYLLLSPHTCLLLLSVLLPEILALYVVTIKSLLAVAQVQLICLEPLLCSCILFLPISLLSMFNDEEFIRPKTCVPFVFFIMWSATLLLFLRHPLFEAPVAPMK